MYTRNTVLLVLLLLAVSSTTLISATAWSDENTAKSILKKMSIYTGKQQVIELSFDSSIEVITSEMEKIQFTNSGEALLQRPNKLAAHRLGGYADVSMYYDGKTVAVHGRHLNSYAEFEAPADIDALLHALREGHGIALPGSDLLLTNAYEVLVADVMEAKYIGRGIVNGCECEHLAFRNFDTDWQLWVEVGEIPIPRKMVVTSKTINSAPQYTLSIKTWKAGVVPTGNPFSFKPPAGIKKVEADQLVEFDELPPGAPVGESQ